MMGLECYLHMSSDTCDGELADSHQSLERNFYLKMEKFPISDLAGGFDRID